MRSIAYVLLMIAVMAGGMAAPAQASATALRPATGLRPATVLVNQPASTVCVGKTFKVGVWFQRSGGSRAYRVAVYNPRGALVFYRHGNAPSARWAFWRIRAKLAGTYRTVYSGHWKKPKVWTKFRAKTRARHC
jgi:hypothetical protein